jgi:hypothetical protein
LQCNTFAPEFERLEVEACCDFPGTLLPAPAFRDGNRHGGDQVPDGAIPRASGIPALAPHTIPCCIAGPDPGPDRETLARCCMALVIMAIGVLATVIPTVALEGFSGLGLPDIVFQLIPFLVLAAFARSLSRIGLSILAVLLIVGTAVNQVGVHTSEGSTAGVGLVLYPLLFAIAIWFGVFVDQAVRDAAHALRRRNV